MCLKSVSPEFRPNGHFDWLRFALPARSSQVLQPVPLQLSHQHAPLLVLSGRQEGLLDLGCAQKVGRTDHHEPVLAHGQLSRSFGGRRSFSPPASTPPAAGDRRFCFDEQADLNLLSRLCLDHCSQVSGCVSKLVVTSNQARGLTPLPLLPRPPGASQVSCFALH